MRVRRPMTGSPPGPPSVSHPGTWEPSPLRRLLRRPIVSWGIAGALALVAGTVVADTTTEAARLRDGYGASREVLITDVQVASGELLAPALVRRSLPVAAIPDDALDTIEPSATATAPISAGAVLTRQDVAGAGGLGPDEAAVAVPIGPAVPSTEPGTPVWLVIAADPFAAIGAGLVAGRVLTVTDEAVTVVVAVAELATVSAATGAGVVGLALRGE
jgi:hypothetical protein